MNNLNDNLISGIPVVQNQQEFIIGVFSIKKILKFTKYTKRLIISYDDENNPIYNDHIQREIEKSRVEKIADFLIEDPEATFPTNIVLSIPLRVIKSQNLNGGFIEILLDEDVFIGVEKENKQVDTGDIHITIIDGQHRIRGIEVAIDRLKINIKEIIKTLGRGSSISLQEKLYYYQQRLEDLLNIQLVVSFFIDKTLEYQAMIFSTINRTQKRVSESLVSSLFGLSTKDSPHKTALQITLALNSHKNSPFFNRIKLYGGSYERNQSPPLSQAGMVKSIVNLISESLREAELDRNRSRKDLNKRSDSSSKYLPMRHYYATNQDTKISDIFYYYFSSVKETFKRKDGTSYWDFNPETMKPTNILQTTVGYQALLRILNDILIIVTSDEERTNKNIYTLYLDRSKSIDFGDNNIYPFSNKAANLLYYDMNLKIWPPTSKDDVRLQKRKEIIESAG
ncbi:DGQHR domain-containing protein [Telluribacter sp.]|jgi:DGQHR domain-containing protein|uniref:DGQHR domain-containing protein n=1 Tax=Telluribacter sp. TaxID=1978767 RepID=UPI002E0E8B59|nr:DGQHR domain-containing protein [Telluribacter sp.]